MVNLTYELTLITKKKDVLKTTKICQEKCYYTLLMNQSVFLKIYHKIDLIELQKCKIFHKMNITKS